MMKETKIIIALTIILVILFGGIIITKNPLENDNTIGIKLKTDKKTQQENPNPEQGNFANLKPGSKEETEDNQTKTSPGSGGSIPENKENPKTNTQLPDFENEPCGIHFLNYGECSGVCPSGKCVHEGDSCYCKE